MPLKELSPLNIVFNLLGHFVHFKTPLPVTRISTCFWEASCYFCQGRQSGWKNVVNDIKTVYNGFVEDQVIGLITIVLRIYQSSVERVEMRAVLLVLMCLKKCQLIVEVNH